MIHPLFRSAWEQQTFISCASSPRAGAWVILLALATGEPDRNADLLYFLLKRQRKIHAEVWLLKTTLDTFLWLDFVFIYKIVLELNALMKEL